MGSLDFNSFIQFVTKLKLMPGQFKEGNERANQIRQTENTLDVKNSKPPEQKTLKKDEKGLFSSLIDGVVSLNFFSKKKAPNQ